MSNKSTGFLTPDQYAVVPWGKRLVIIYQGEQLDDVSTVRQANAFIKKHRENSNQGITKFTT